MNRAIRRSALGTAAAALVALGGLATLGARTPPPHVVDAASRGWPDYGGGPDQSKYVETPDLDRRSVQRLTVAWTYGTGDSAAYQFNPIVVDTVMYVLAKGSSLVALDARTGKELWIHANLRGINRRGINYWESADRSDRRLLFATSNWLQAIDARTGQSILTFGTNGRVDLREGLGRDPRTVGRVQSGGPGRVFANLLLLGSSTGEDYFSTPGHLRAFDVVTGRQVWVFHTIPQPGEYGHDTWPKDAWRYAGGVNTWGEISLDSARGIAYFPVGSPTYDYYGADRVGSDLFGTSLLALDARTGKRLWHFQLVHHDLWDYDPTAAPQLVTVTHDGRRVDAVAQATKQGFLFVFDRVTGQPLWPIEERPVPKSDVPGEQAWPTQPFPTVLPPFARQVMTSRDLTTLFLTPAERASWTRRIDAARKGLFVPPSLTRETIAVPGAVGGANWGNTAADPAHGIVYVLNQDFPSFYRLEKREPRSAVATGGSALEHGGAVYAASCAGCHGANRQGGTGPTLVGVGARLSFADFRFVVTDGRGQMPAFAHLDERSLRDVYAYLGGRGLPNGAGPAAVAATPASTALPSGPVVASGGAPLPPATPPGALPNGPFEAADANGYPSGVTAPTARYTTDYGLGHPYIMRPPWSTIVAYDLDRGVIKWKVPLGQDLRATEAGATGTGVPRGSQRNGMIVTSTGLVFSTAKDGHVYAFDADDGRVLWSAQLPTGTEGLPAMYAIDGRHYLVVNATTPLTWGKRSRESGIGATGPYQPGGYVVFALPQ